MTSRELVCLLLERFPDVREVVCDEDCFDLSTIVYDSFARIVIQRSDDAGFMQAVGSFIDELAESEGALVREVLTSCLLEGIASERTSGQDDLAHDQPAVQESPSQGGT